MIIILKFTQLMMSLSDNLIIIILKKHLKINILNQIIQPDSLEAVLVFKKESKTIYDLLDRQILCLIELDH